ncbi:MAG TPA: hypothetical protein VIF15_21975 [Polyangiaceae bacterium]|jgi:hypothetical protein
MRVRTLLAATVAAVVLASAPAARADGVLPAVATPVQREQAQSRFLRAKDLMAKKQYDQALVEFRASHDIVGSPNTRLEISRCLRAMGRLVAAYAELGRTAIEAKELVAQDNRYQRAYDAATAERADIEPQLGFVSLTIQNPSEGTTVTVGGEELRRAAWSEPAPALAGSAEVVVQTPGHLPVKRSVALAAGQRTSLTIDAQSGPLEGAAAPPPEPAPEPPAPSSPIPLRTWAYVAGGIGAAGLVTFAVAAIMAKSTYDDLGSACNGGPCPASKADEISSGKTQQTIANVGLVVGILGVGTGATLFVLSRPKSADAPATAVVVSPGWVGLRGSW